MVGHFNPYGAFAGNGRNDPNPQGRKRQGNVIFQVFDFWDPDARGGNNFVECHRGANIGFDFGDLNFVIPQRVNDFIFIDLQFVFINGDAPTAVVLQQF